MSLPYQVRPSLKCPRCGVALPLNEKVCYNCGERFTPSASSIPTTGRSQTPNTSRIDKRQIQGPSRRASLVYFMVSLLVIVLFSYAGLRAAGISFSSLIATTQNTNVFKESYPTLRGTPLFADRFTDDGSGWNLQSVPGSYAVTVGNGVLSLESDKQRLLWEPLPGTRTYSNFQLTADAMLAKGDSNNGYGFYIRGGANQGSELATYYRFELYGDGSYAIFKGSTDASGKSVDTKLVDFLLDPAIARQGKFNHILIIAKGPSMSFVVNDHLLQTITDSSYTTGSIALFVSNLPEAKPGAQAHFSQFAVYPL